MSVIFSLDLKSMKFPLKGKGWAYLILFILIGSGCKRIVKQDAQEVPIVSATDYKAEMKRIMGLKLPQKTIVIDQQYSFSIPAHYIFSVQKLVGADVQELGKMDLSALKDSISVISFGNVLSKDERLYEQSIMIIPESDSTLLSVEDIKADFPNVETVYFQDENSIIFDQNDNFIALHLKYDALHKSYIFYKAEMGWSQKLPKEEKINLFSHLIRNAKNFTNKTDPAIQFKSWEEYVRNLPVIEVNMVKRFFKKLEKELVIFLDEGETITPRTEGNYELAALSRLTTNEQLGFLKFIDAVKANKVSELNNSDYNRDVFEVSNQNKYTLSTDGNSYIINISRRGYDDVFNPATIEVICPIDYRNKSFVLKTMVDDLQATDVDLFVKIFNYFSKHYTLDLKSK
ncbi:hypothetical protein SAMN05421820_101784 [Pedobacter steynii]|uniref:Uncharacterized protein n=2 Tax=Pedobacter steynii TaxID=430522 RepID=A0A1G9L6I2_9SPHI|nr:hypothetical protein SAMN05421820_101784 [Pedobacter steynii]